MESTMPIEKIKNWITEEKALGSPSADSVVLATASAEGKVHSRIVAIREVTQLGILFFTQKRSRKAQDLSENPSASMTLWLPLKQREVVLDGIVEPLSQQENQSFWESLPRERQLRFLTYKSGQLIHSLNDLQKEYDILEQKYHHQTIPMDDCYCGYRLVPNRIYFYTLGQDTFSEVIQYSFEAGNWQKNLVSP